MRPSFSSKRHGLAFAGLLLGLIGLPGFIGTFGNLDRQSRYASAPPETLGPIDYIGNQIFEDATDLDLAFVGPSNIWVAIDVPYVQDELSRKLGREAKVRMLGYRFEGPDLGYLYVKDLLEHRRLRMLVVYLPNSSQTNALPHNQIFRLLQIGKDSELFSGVGLASQVSLYASAVLGMPRQLVSALRPDLPAPPSEYERYLGAGPQNDIFRDLSPAFVPFHADAPKLDPKSLIYSEQTRDRFRFPGPPLNPYQEQVFRLLTQLCHEHHVHLVAISLPSFLDRRSPQVRERMPWPEVLGPDVDLIGIPPAELFAGLTDVQIMHFFYGDHVRPNGDHLNRNGSEFFTRAITPALLGLL